MGDGKEVIELLAKNPNTAKFISTKLARRFVSDTPPQSLIAKMVQTFQSSDGDIRAVMHTMIIRRNSGRAKPSAQNKNSV